MIVNVLGASRLWHVAKILIPPPWVTDKFKSMIFKFIWKGKMENVSRRRCCAPLDSGGLNIISFEEKCASLRLSNFSTLRDDFGSAKWHYLARYFLSSRLSVLDARFNFTSVSVPSSSEPSLYYRKCLALFTKLHRAHGSLPDDLSSKYLYSLLMEKPVEAPRPAGFWEAAVGRPINRWAWVWRKSRYKFNENKKNDLLWQIIHRAIRVRYSLRIWGYTNNDKCAICSLTETIEHCFLECSRAVAIWNIFSPHISQLANSTFTIATRTIFFPLDESFSSPNVHHYLIATILFWLWHARNMATFRNKVLSSDSISELIRKDIKLRLASGATDRIKHFSRLECVL